MKSASIQSLCALALCVLAACAAHGGSSLPSVPGSANYGGAASFDWGKPLLSGASYVGPANVAHMRVDVVVRPQDAQGLAQYAQMVSDPTSAFYRRFLTPQEIGARFGATPQDYQKAAYYFVGNGLHVAGWPQHFGLAVAGPQAAMEKAFGTKFGVFTKQGYTFVAPLGTPHLSSSVPVVSATNLVALNTKHRYFVAPPRANGADEVGYSPQVLREAFDFTSAYKAGYNGSGVTIAIVGTGPIAVSGSSGCNDSDLAKLESLYGVTAARLCQVPVTPSGVAAGLHASGIPTASPTWSPVPNATPSPNPGTPSYVMFPYSGDFQTPPPVSTAPCKGTLPSCNPEDVEAQLDTQQSATLAPGATVNFYLAYNAADCYVYFPDSCAASGSNKGAPAIGITEADAEIQQIIADDTSDVVSISYGGGEPQQVGFGFGPGQNPTGFETLEFAAMAAEGMAVFVSSGDTGVAECLGSGGQPFEQQQCVGYPSGDPNVTSVGGVNAPINAFGQFASNVTAWGTTNGGLSQSDPTNASGSGGGTSTIFTAPSWQQTAVGATMREQPDVSMIGDPITGVTIETNGSCPTSGGGCPNGPMKIGGTSVAAPEMAAVWAVVLSACAQSPSCTAGGPSVHPFRLGNAAPYFYSILHGSNLVSGTGRSAPSGFPYLPYSQVFYDIVYGNNDMPGSKVGSPVQGFNAGPGYDEVTGVGVPFVRHLVTAVTNK